MLPFSDVRTGPPEWAKQSIPTTIAEERSGPGGVLTGSSDHSSSDHQHRRRTDISAATAGQTLLSDSEYYGFGSWPDAETLQKASFDWLASALLAMDHFVSTSI
jgi:hypothetical protein